jgi:hypothetical protein
MNRPALLVVLAASYGAVLVASIVIVFTGDASSDDWLFGLLGLCALIMCSLTLRRLRRVLLPDAKSAAEGGAQSPDR